MSAEALFGVIKKAKQLMRKGAVPVECFQAKLESDAGPVPSRNALLATNTCFS